MERSDFLVALSDASRGANSFLNAQGRSWLATIIAGQDEDAEEIDIDRVFELLCYFKFLDTLTPHVQNLRLIPGDGRRTGYRFPYGPGNKENFAFFRFQKDNRSYDICCGTALTDRDGEKVHPDISLQRGTWNSTADKSVGQVIAIWDGKFHESRFSKDDLYQMNWWTDVLNLPAYAAADILTQLFPEELQASAVITNAASADVNVKQLLRKRFSIIFNFSTVDQVTLPTRAEHMANGPQPAPPAEPVNIREFIESLND